MGGEKFKEMLMWRAYDSSAIMRIYIIIFFFILAFLILNFRLVLVSTNKNYQLEQAIRANFYRKDIVDRNGILVATSLPIYSLFANPDKIYNKAQTLEKLAKVIDIKNKSQVLADLNSGKNFIWIKHDITPSQEQLINELGLVGIGLEKSFKRIYPYGNLISHALGYVSRDNKGLAGLERFFDDELMVDNFNSPNPANKDKSLELTLDVHIQSIANQELDNAINEFNAEGGAAVVADPNSGEILALISKPDFNPHNPAKATPDELFNKTSLAAYEFGSVFKILTLAIGLETKVTNINRQYDISSLKVGKFNIKDFKHSTGIHTVAEIFAKSSNKGTGKIALEIGKNNFQKYLRKLRLDDQVITEISEKTTPKFPVSQNWSDISMVTISYGYGIATSVLNLIQAVIPTINGGVLYPLTLVKKDIEPEGEKIFSQETCRDIRKLLRLVVLEGSGKKADIKGYMVGGKSGTANKLNGKHYAKNSRRSSFIATFPANKPRYVVYVMLDNPQPTKETGGYATGGATAAPTVGKIISRIASLKGILPQYFDEQKSDDQQIFSKLNGV